MLEHPLKNIPLVIDHDLHGGDSSGTPTKNLRRGSLGPPPRINRSRKWPSTSCLGGHAAPGGMPAPPAEQEAKSAEEQEQKQATQ
jgi:hypothetical protein